MITNIKFKFRSGKQLLAIEECEKACSSFPNSVKLKKLAALMMSHLGNQVQAANYLKQAYQLEPNDLDTIFNLGLGAKIGKDYLTAIEWFVSFLQLEDRDIDAWIHLVDCQIITKQYKNALNSIKKAQLNNCRNKTLIHLNANVLEMLGQHELALIKYQEVVDMDPNFHVAWSNMGVTLQKLNRYKEALVSLNEAIRLNPNYPQVYQNKGLYFLELKLEDEALIQFQRAIQLSNNFAEPWFSTGLIFQNNKDYKRSLYFFEKAYEINPQLNYLLGCIVHVMSQMCYWKTYDDYVVRIIEETKKNNLVIMPFMLLNISDSPNVNLRNSELQIAYLKKIEVPSTYYEPNKKSKKKIRIGYFSADFRDHPVGHLISGIFKYHDKTQFEIIGFSLNTQQESEIFIRLKGFLDQMIDLSTLSDLTILELVRDLDIDIAIDLGGDTKDNRFNLFIERLAPVQIGYLGFLGTMGNCALDYLIADETLVPKESIGVYSEKIIYLPNYHVNDPEYLKTDKALSRRDYGLPEKEFVFCCFNNSFKITPRVFSVWMRILSAVEDSVIFIYAENNTVKENLTSEAKLRGVNPNRIIYAEKVSRKDYLARSCIVDLFLDTSPYNAGTTACDSLFVGLPILTCIGKTFSGRIAASALIAVGLPELVTDNLKQYELLAIKLAKNPDLFLSIKQKLLRNKHKSLIYNPKEFTVKLESGYKAAWNRFYCGLKPDHIYINN